MHTWNANNDYHSSLIYLLRTVSICFCWNLPLMMSWWLPSTDPLRKGEGRERGGKDKRREGREEEMYEANE